MSLLKIIVAASLPAAVPAIAADAAPTLIELCEGVDDWCNRAVC